MLPHYSRHKACAAAKGVQAIHHGQITLRLRELFGLYKVNIRSILTPILNVSPSCVQRPWGGNILSPVWGWITVPLAFASILLVFPCSTAISERACRWSLPACWASCRSSCSTVPRHRIRLSHLYP